jgi:RNA polymerase sigma-70 factor (ECF subfamily)
MGAKSILACKPSQDDLYLEASTTYGAALDHLARAYEAEAEPRRDLLQEIHLALAASHIVRQRRTSIEALVSLEELEAIPDRTDSELSAARHHALKRLFELIQTLKPVDRQVILSYLEGEDPASTGEILGISPANVAMKIHRIKSILTRRFYEGEHRGI